MIGMFCPHCGTEVSSDFSFCPKCGKKISDQQSALSTQQSEPRISSRQSTANDSDSAMRNPKSEMVTCPTCGFQNSSDAKSCESCGTFLKGAVSHQQ